MKLLIINTTESAAAVAADTVHSADTTDTADVHADPSGLLLKMLWLYTYRNLQDTFSLSLVWYLEKAILRTTTCYQPKLANPRTILFVV